MSRSIRHEEFLGFRSSFPYFSFDRQQYQLSPKGLEISYEFSLSGAYSFHPSIFIPRKPFFKDEYPDPSNLDALVFHIGLTEMISYWKAACPPRVIIRPFALGAAQVNWWKKLWFKGLGEFFYLNSINTTQETFLNLEFSTSVTFPRLNIETANEILIPVGGGKDSAVTLELLGGLPGSLPMIMNPRRASTGTIHKKGFHDDHCLEIRRTLDPALLKLNEAGFLNGHTPFSALLAFISLLGATLTGRRHVALSNESSSSEPTIPGSEVNHQYSKSLEFESDFRDYVKNHLTDQISYFSFLRPLNELQIASVFSRYKKYHDVFRSCNAGSKTDTWCGKCSKCLFTFIMLAPFLTTDELHRIFGNDLFGDVSLMTYFDQLTGIADEKPFECVGTLEEVNMALCEVIRKNQSDPLPVLPDHYRHSELYNIYKERSFSEFLTLRSDEHHLIPEFAELLNNGFQA